MTSVEALAEPVQAEPAQDADVAAAVNPALLGLPAFIAGSVALGLTFVGYAPGGAAAALLSIIVLGSGLGLTIATVWAAAVGQGPVVAILGTMAMFWLSLPTLQLGLAHGWFGQVDTATAANAVSVFALCWFVVVVMLTIATLRLPSIFTVLFVLIDVSLFLVFKANSGAGPTSAGMMSIAGVIAFVFAGIGVYMFIDAMGTATGGRPLPMGKPLKG